jgi:ATP-dependent DNA helicase RecG
MGSAGDQLVLLTGSLGAAERRETLEKIADGRAAITVGTHALLSEGVEFKDLGLVVVDEQHRFGVEQRAALAAKAQDGTRPHVLVMTATPIPRTVAMTVFGDLDVSVLRELPAGRAPIATHVVLPRTNPSHLVRTWQRVHEEVGRGHQVYVVCPRIGGGESETDQHESDDAKSSERAALAVLEVAPLLIEGPLKGLNVETLHGRMSAESKEDVMVRFAAGKSAEKPIDVLITTTVIEVGVDVPNANMIVILDADRFGVSQLHQLRGRVGRGQTEGLCLLVSESPENSPARERLTQVAATTDGFELAQADLQLRKEGDILGASQSGRRSQLRLLEVIKDADLVAEAREAAIEWVDFDPELKTWPALQTAVAEINQERPTEFLERN